MQDLEQQAARLFLNHHRTVLNMAFRMAPLADMAEDIAQDVFVEFVSHADRWNLAESIEPILVRITQNVAMRHWVKRKKAMDPLLFEIARSLQKLAEEDDLADGNESVLSALNICLDKLPPRSRKTVDLRYQKRLSMKEIGKICDKTPKAVQLSLFRIRKALRACIERILREA